MLILVIHTWPEAECDDDEPVGRIVSARKSNRIDVCDRRYVFDAQSSGNFSPAEQCPAYSVPQEIASAVYNKERQD